MDAFVGQIAALGAALSFAFTSTFFTLAGRKFSATSTLVFSLPISFLVLIFVHLVVVGDWFPLSAGLDRWFYLGFSGVAGFVVSSLFLLRAFQYIGPRLSLLVSSSSPILSTVLAWIFLDQALPPNAILGIALVTSGIIWVVSDSGKTQRDSDFSNPDFRKGLMFAFAGALGQAVAFVFSSQGVSGDFPPMSASLMRTTAGLICMWVLVILQQDVRYHVRLMISEPRSMLFILIATLSGPVIGASLVLVGLQFTSVGIASTLTNTTPIILIPIGYFVFKEQITLRAIMGTLVAIAGIAILFT